MPHKEWKAEVDGHSIRVTNSWLGGAKLYIDGECRDINNKLLADPNRPALSARLMQENNESPPVEVFVKMIYTVKAKICVTGKQVGGDAI